MKIIGFDEHEIHKMSTFYLYNGFLHEVLKFVGLGNSKC